MYTITSEDLMQYLNGLSAEKKTAQIKKELEKNWKLRLSLETLASMQSLPDIQQSAPSDQVIEILLKNGAERKRKNFRPL